MRLTFVIDPVDTLDLELDTSIGLMRAAQHRGDEIWVTEAHRLEAVDGRARALARPIRFGDHLAPQTGEPEHLWLSDMDAVFMRTEPPLDEVYLAATFILDLIDQAHTAMINDPGGLRACSEHLFPLRFPDLIPATLVTASPQSIQSFVDEHKLAVIKPVDGYSGRGVLRLEHGDANLASLLEISTRHGRNAAVVQAFLPEVADGNKRVFVADGEPIGAVYRYPDGDDFRIGPPSAHAPVSPRDRHICARLAPSLRRHGLRMVGLDIIGSHLIDVNVTSPGAMRKTDLLLGTSHCADLLEVLL